MNVLRLLLPHPSTLDCVLRPACLTCLCSGQAVLQSNLHLDSTKYWPAQYSTAVSSSTEDPGESIEQIRARIFDQQIGNQKRSGRKILLRPLKGKEIADWYFFPDKSPPFLEDEMETE